MQAPFMLPSCSTSSFLLILFLLSLPTLKVLSCHERASVAQISRRLRGGCESEAARGAGRPSRPSVSYMWGRVFAWEGEEERKELQSLLCCRARVIDKCHVEGRDGSLTGKQEEQDGGTDRSIELEHQAARCPPRCRRLPWRQLPARGAETSRRPAGSITSPPRPLTANSFKNTATTSTRWWRHGRSSAHTATLDLHAWQFELVRCWYHERKQLCQGSDGGGGEERREEGGRREERGGGLLRLVLMLIFSGCVGYPLLVRSRCAQTSWKVSSPPVLFPNPIFSCSSCPFHLLSLLPVPCPLPGLVRLVGAAVAGGWQPPRAVRDSRDSSRSDG
eukprot:596102-Hanusia_phi.AAC.4